jgi:signal transduction histidine kinase
MATASARERTGPNHHGLFQSMGLPALVIEPDLTAAQVNATFLEVFGGTAQAHAQSRDWLTRFSATDAERLRAFLVQRRVEARSVPTTLPCRMIDREGQPRDVVIAPSPIRDATRRLLVVLDVSDLRQAEREIMDESESERRAVGKDIHDGLGQTLTGVALLADVLARQLEAQKRAEAGIAQDLSRMVNEAVDQSRRVARRINPVRLEKHGFQAALERLARSVETLHDVPCFFEGDPELRITDTALATHIYWIAREGLRNAVQHGDPETLTLSLKQDAGKIVLSVAYAGVPLPDDWTRRIGRGWRTMSYRATLIGAALALEHKCDGEAKIVCVLDAPRTDAAGSSQA